MYTIFWRVGLEQINLDQDYHELQISKLGYSYKENKINQRNRLIFVNNNDQEEYKPISF